MLIMGLESEYANALEFVKKIDFSKSDEPAKGFETGIRYLGGLLSANDIRPDPILVQKAVEVTEKVLLPLFNSKSGAPYTYMDLTSGQPQPTRSINLAEFGTYTLEFTRLSQVTGDPKYAKVANDLVDRAIRKPTEMPGLFPSSWDLATFEPQNASIITVGGGADSFYEYLPKTNALLSGAKQDWIDTWEDSVDSIQKYLLSPTKEDPSIQFVAAINNHTVSYATQELICFWPGNLLLGATQMKGDTSKVRNFADVFMKSCMVAWDDTATGIAPEVWSWTPKEAATKGPLGSIIGGLKDWFGENKGSSTKKRSMKKRNTGPFKIENGLYDLRPETLESIFYYYRVTQDTSYQDWAWKVFQAIDKYTRTESGFTMIKDVDTIPPPKDNFQESYIFAELFKYLYLTFTDTECMSLNKYVFSTEGHPFILPEPIQLQK
ncbi:glycoside hydrolase [Syncephalastrum racemosum]|uniref:alpha-1,2-Mannosidase n=1 Tax=Syncephalastrum racemosum TaxID=13706 RepID=A0A1X2HTV9_SYNRA|nr:glycoside hydrolase [Syncephalastrum racemosum]